MEKEADIDEFDIEDFYEANFEKYHEPEQVKASHILIMVKADDDEETVEKAQQKAVEIRTNSKLVKILPPSPRNTPNVLPPKMGVI